MSHRALSLLAALAACSACARATSATARATRPSCSSMADRRGYDASIRPTSRAELVAAFEPELGRIPDGRDHLDRALATIDGCIAARARAGDIAGALH